MKLIEIKVRKLIPEGKLTILLGWLLPKVACWFGLEISFVEVKLPSDGQA